MKLLKKKNLKWRGILQDLHKNTPSLCLDVFFTSRKDPWNQEVLQVIYILYGSKLIACLI